MKLYPNGFNLPMAEECCEAFSASTGLGASIETFKNECLASYGVSCGNCKISSLLKKSNKRHTSCEDMHLYGMLQAERFGGKYIYFCPAGLNFIISPLTANGTAVAYIKAGPFLMIEREDYIKFDLERLLAVDCSDMDNIRESIETLPVVMPDLVTKLSTLLYMSVSYINSLMCKSTKQKSATTAKLQGHISEMIQCLRPDANLVEKDYPFEKEGEIVSAIVSGDKQTADRLLNELLGYIFFYSEGKYEVIRARVFELLVLLSRGAVEGGADAQYIFDLNCRHYSDIQNINQLDELCIWLNDIMTDLCDYVFRFSDVKHADAIRKSVDYMRRNYSKKLTLEEVSAYVFLSPSYFSKVFKEEMNCNYNNYLNMIRVDKAKQLLMNENIRLVDISGLVGFEDQSYFSKVFKRFTDMSPGKFREANIK